MFGDNGYYVLLAIFAVFILWQLHTGEFSGARGGRSWKYTRRDNPVAYTIAMTLQVAAFIYLWVSSAEKKSALDKERAERVVVRAERAKARAARAAARAEDSAKGVKPRPNVEPFRRQIDSAFALARADQHAEAVKVYDMVLRNQEDADILHWRGIAHWKLSNPDLAMADMRRAIKLNPDRYDSYLVMDLILSDRQQWDSILPLWNQYIERHPTNADAIYARGGAYNHKGDRVAALADATKACELGEPLGCQVAARIKTGNKP